jgi:hypothetical protein
MIMKEGKIALIVHACDRYEFLFKGFDYFFSKHWDFTIPCNYYFATEVKSASINGFQNIQSGKGEWSDRLAFLLREKIQEEYILYFQEDMWLNKNVNPRFFQQLFDIVLKEGWKQVKIHSGEYITEGTGRFIEGFSISKVNSAASNHLMSHQVTLWDKEFLLSQLYKNEHPWRNEREGTKRLRKLNQEIFHLDYFAEMGTPPVNKNLNPVGRSEYQTISVNGMLNHNVKPFINELMELDDESKNYAAALQYHYDNNLTHDGKSKPRGNDGWHKFKRWLRGKGE